MHKIYFIILLIGLFSACIEVVDLDVEETPQELVVNCFFTEGQPFVVNVSRLAAYPDLTDRNLEDATVSIYENDILKGTLKHTENGIYTRNSISPTYGNMYSIKVEVPGYPTATASDTIPEKVSIQECNYRQNAGVDEEGDPYGEIITSFTDHPNVKYYSIQIYSRWEKPLYDQNGYPAGSEVIWYPIEQTSFDPVIIAEGITKNDYCTYFVFNDALFFNRNYKLTVNASSEYESNDKLKVLLETGTANYYQYRKRLLKHEPYSYEDPFKPYSPVPLYSNVSGGQGIFAGYQRDIYYLNFSE
ncbi:DUF4249 domain-containing protein [uncultured Draconibacterium sp.]|uniref:DUF4249 domain-containing protein n=1 Tax=uncultured Draconibacterium sp. TaxID=1573823 RepID=UPI002AA9597E|nr:DUF4249 domain-containing protein [uncultured Draconibacterium sp.]